MVLFLSTHIFNKEGISMKNGDKNLIKRRNKYFVIIAIITILIFGLLYIQYLLSIEKDEGITTPETNSLLYLGKTEDGWYKIEFISTASPNFYLEETMITLVQEENDTVAIIFLNLSLSQVKMHNQNLSPDDNISYLNADNDDFLSHGDIIAFRLNPSKYSEYNVKLISKSGHAIATLTFKPT
jgi:uncharacterized protein YciU (UPF0263 family)